MSDVYHFRQRKDDFLKNDPSSPVAGSSFEALRYYPVTESFVVRAQLKPFDLQDEVKLPTNTGEPEAYRRFARAEFRINETSQALTLYLPLGGDGARAFVPFADKTNGAETYAGGRYLEVNLNKGGPLRLDFNYAYNPFCAYSERYRCPLPPEENRLNMFIRAGEKAFE